MHNTGAIGIALLCGYDAHCWAPAGKDASLLDVAYENDHLARTDCAVIDYGEEPPTRKQIEAMAKIVALLCRPVVSAGARHPGRRPVPRRPAAAGQGAVLSGYCGGSIIICCMQ